jgi:hypothetical protein
MTHTSWNMSGNDPASGDVRRISSLLILALVLLVWCAPVQAADTPVGPFLFTSSTRSDKDIEIETKILRALRKDAQLKGLNLGVHMSGGIARLSGPVPSPQLKQQVIAIVERVEGVLKVNVKDLYISGTANGRKQIIVIPEDEQPTQTRSASPRVLSSVTEPQRQDGGSAVPPAASQQVTLLAPEAVTRPVRVPEAACLTAHPRPASLADAIPSAIERLRRNNTRFQSIRTQVQGSSVHIFPSDAPGEDPMTFAQAVRRLPGVQHVIVASGSP